MSLEHPVVALDRLRRERCIAADTTALAPMMTDELIYVHTSGAIDTKQSFLDRVGSGELTYHRIEPGAVVVRDHGVAVRVSGDIHIEVTASSVFKDLYARYVQEWLRTDAGWQLDYWQTTIDQAAAAAAAKR